MTYLYIFIVLAALGLLYMSFEAGFVQVKRVRFTKDSNSLKILQLSDIHIKKLKVSPLKVKKIIDSEKPDFIVMSGDYIEKECHVPLFLDFLDRIKGDHKIFLCLGNHDYTAFIKNQAGLSDFLKTIEDRGIEILHNRSVCFTKGSKTYNIIGIADLRDNHHDIDESLKSCNPDAYANIAFSHNPDITLQIPKGKVDYLFAGHYHGGQIWMPFNLEFRVLRSDKLCRQGIRRGLHKVNGINLYINKGLGNVCLPFRFLSRPEITVFHMP